MWAFLVSPSTHRERCSTCKINLADTNCHSTRFGQVVYTEGFVTHHVFQSGDPDHHRFPELGLIVGKCW